MNSQAIEQFITVLVAANHDSDWEAGELEAIRNEILHERRLCIRGDFLQQHPLAIIPPEIRMLSSLEILDLNFTNIRMLPEQIHELKRLNWLDLSHTLLAELPASLETL